MDSEYAPRTVAAESIDERLRKAEATFDRLAEKSRQPIIAARLAGKAQGIRMARRFVEEEAAFYDELAELMWHA